MTIVFCSERLERLISHVEPATEVNSKNKLGAWSGHVFIIDRKRNIIFTHDRTSYSFVILNVKKSLLKDFDDLFRESLIKQLYFDLTINEKQEIKIRKWLEEIVLAKSDALKPKRVPRDYIHLIKEEALQKGLEHLNDIVVGSGLNNHFIGTKLKPGPKKYAIPKELIQILIDSNGN